MITLTRALTGMSVDIPVDKITSVDIGPHGGALVTVSGVQRIGVVETREQVRALMRANA